MPFFSRSALKDGVAMREVWSWAAFDFANSGYTTVVLTAVFNAYFVSVVAGDAPSATFLWTVVIAVSNAVSMLLMPVIGTVADATATKEALARRRDLHGRGRHARPHVRGTGHDRLGLPHDHREQRRLQRGRVPQLGLPARARP